MAWQVPDLKVGIPQRLLRDFMEEDQVGLLGARSAAALAPLITSKADTHLDIIQVISRLAIIREHIKGLILEDTTKVRFINLYIYFTPVTSVRRVRAKISGSRGVGGPKRCQKICEEKLSCKKFFLSF